MSLLNGFIDHNGHPRLPILVEGPSGLSQTFDAIIDTGFTDFVLLPEMSAYALGLLPTTSGVFRLASGERVSLTLALGVIKLSKAESYTGLVVLGESNNALIGMQFLRQAKKAFYVDSNSAALLDEDELRSIVSK
jgi:predicted aspartyl protease